MAKKTKKQKIKSKERRQKQQYTPHASAVSPHEQQLPDPTIPVFSFTRTSTAKTSKEEDKTMYSCSISDLKKTTILAILSIGILIALSFVLK